MQLSPGEVHFHWGDACRCCFDDIAGEDFPPSPWKRGLGRVWGWQSGRLSKGLRRLGPEKPGQVGQVGQVAQRLREDIDHTTWPDLSSTFHLPSEKVLFPPLNTPCLVSEPRSSPARLRGLRGLGQGDAVSPGQRQGAGPGLLVVRPLHLTLGLPGGRGLWLSGGAPASLLG